MHVAIQTQLLTVSEATAFQIHSHHVALHLCALGHRIMHHDLRKSFLSYLSALRSLRIVFKLMDKVPWSFRMVYPFIGAPLRQKPVVKALVLVLSARLASGLWTSNALTTLHEVRFELIFGRWLSAWIQAQHSAILDTQILSICSLDSWWIEVRLMSILIHIMALIVHIYKLLLHFFLLLVHHLIAVSWVVFYWAGPNAAISDREVLDGVFLVVIVRGFDRVEHLVGARYLPLIFNTDYAFHDRWHGLCGPSGIILLSAIMVADFRVHLRDLVFALRRSHILILELLSAPGRLLVFDWLQGFGAEPCKLMSCGLFA